MNYAEASTEIDFIGNKLLIERNDIKYECTVDQTLIDSGDVDTILKTLKCVRAIDDSSTK